MIHSLAPEYDMIIVDTPVLEESSDTLLISQNADDTIVVLEQGRTSGTKAERLTHFLAITNKKALGIVLNKVGSV